MRNKDKLLEIERQKNSQNIKNLKILRINKMDDKQIVKREDASSELMMMFSK